MLCPPLLVEEGVFSLTDREKEGDASLVSSTAHNLKFVLRRRRGSKGAYNRGRAKYYKAEKKRNRKEQTFMPYLLSNQTITDHTTLVPSLPSLAYEKISSHFSARSLLGRLRTSERSFDPITADHTNISEGRGDGREGGEEMARSASIHLACFLPPSPSSTEPKRGLTSPSHHSPDSQLPPPEC